jgi:hypothetical protein
MSAVKRSGGFVGLGVGYRFEGRLADGVADKLRMEGVGVSEGIDCRNSHASDSTEGELTRFETSLIEEKVDDCLEGDK